VYFGPGRRRFGWYHGAGAAHRDSGVVFCNPLGYEELCVHRALRHWAESLAGEGFPTLRFDYDGTGNSAGSDFDPDRVGAWITSIEDAAEELRARSGVQRIVLVGVRLGGTLALAAAKRAGAETLILVAPHASGRLHARELRALGRLMRTGGDDAADAKPGENPVEQVAGFTVTAETMAQLSALDPFTGADGVRHALVVPRDDMAAETSIANRLAERGVVVERASLAGYAAMMVDAHESVPPAAIIDGSVRWLAARYPGTHGQSSPSETDGIAEGPHTGGVIESAVVFDRERRLFGVLAESAVEERRCTTGVILVNAGSVHSVGPGRLYVELAREWAAQGFPVLRVDVGGVGDSETRPDHTDNHPYPNHAVEDIRAAAKWMLGRGLTRVVVAGVCSGAHASFHAGLDLEELTGIIVINPIVFYWTPACALDVSAWMNYSESRRYSQSVREVDSWVRLVRGEVNVRYAAGVAYRRMREVAGSAAIAFGRRVGLKSGAGQDLGDDLRRISARGVDVLLVFSEGDPGLDFVRRRHARDVRLLERDRANFRMRVIADADHTFTTRECRARLADLLTAHLVSHHRNARPDSR
jgi:pimeloyl-ACP methyl ester carboxylesterase